MGRDISNDLSPVYIISPTRFTHSINYFLIFQIIPFFLVKLSIRLSHFERSFIHSNSHASIIPPPRFVALHVSNNSIQLNRNYIFLNLFQISDDSILSSSELPIRLSYFPTILHL